MKFNRLSSFHVLSLFWFVTQGCMQWCSVKNWQFHSSKTSENLKKHKPRTASRAEKYLAPYKFLSSYVSCIHAQSGVVCLISAEPPLLAGDEAPPAPGGLLFLSIKPQKKKKKRWFVGDSPVLWAFWKWIGVCCSSLNASLGGKQREWSGFPFYHFKNSDGSSPGHRCQSPPLRLCSSQFYAFLFVSPFFELLQLSSFVVIISL